MNVREIISLYLRHSRATGIHCPQSLAEREHVLGLFAEHIGDMPVDDCKAYHLSDWIEDHEGWKSVSTRRAKANAIRAAFQWAVDDERITRNPFRKVRYAEAERRPDMPDESLAYLECAANKQFEKVLRFLRLTGCRTGELCEARWQDMDFEKCVWTINNHKSRKFTRKAKLVALIPEAIAFLSRITKSLRPLPTDFVFTNTRGTQWNETALSKQLSRMKAKHGLQFRASLHGIRHRFGSAAVAAGAPIKLVSQQMGHSSVVITEKYYCDLSGEMEAIRQAMILGIPKRD